MQVVWFKRDLRTLDHEALYRASGAGDVLPIYIFEPELWNQPDLSHRHYKFLCDCLAELEIELKELGQNLIIKTGNAIEILNQIHNNHQIHTLWSHQETWNDWTYKRDQKVKKWISKNSIIWKQPAQNGVIRNLKSRNGWSKSWHTKMKKPIYGEPKKLTKLTNKSYNLPNAKKLRLEDDNCSVVQKGGRSEALKMLDSFFSQRGRGYTKEVSSPVTAYDSCSRLSPHLAFGTISIREVFQKTEAEKKIRLDTFTKDNNLWKTSLRSFSSRLRWHCHFIQKLEDEPCIEYENMHSTYNTLRQDPINWVHLEAWKKGQTGFPMIDACMRALISTGWLNFRMRAMLVSFASYHLWLHWREPAIYLARLFTDYEPGIHYSQAQMQSGTTGINSIRIYNPIKQGLDHDPEGKFIRKWVPELADLDIKYIHKPWESRIPVDNYPSPIVNEKNARQAAARNIYALRYSSMHKEISGNIFKKHGSRKKNRHIVEINKKRVASLTQKNVQQEMPF